MPTFQKSGGPQMGPAPSTGPNPNYLGPSDSNVSGQSSGKQAFGGKKAPPFGKKGSKGKGSSAAKAADMKKDKKRGIAEGSPQDKDDF